MTYVMGILLELRSVLKLRLNVKLEQGFDLFKRKIQRNARNVKLAHMWNMQSVLH